jgi:hypothetical protein
MERASAPVHALWAAKRDCRKHKGEPKLPFNFVVACSFFIIEGRSIVVFGNRCPLLLFFGDPHPGSRANVFF